MTTMDVKWMKSTDKFDVYATNGAPGFFGKPLYRTRTEGNPPATIRVTFAAVGKATVDRDTGEAPKASKPRKAKASKHAATVAAQAAINGQPESLLEALQALPDEHKVAIGAALIEQAAQAA